MTSPSHRKPRTTPRNTRRVERACRLLLLACGTSALATFAQIAPAQDASPLDRLRQRSARERWESIRPTYDVVRGDSRAAFRGAQEPRPAQQQERLSPAVRGASSTQPALISRGTTPTRPTGAPVDRLPSAPPILPLPTDAVVSPPSAPTRLTDSRSDASDPLPTFSGDEPIAPEPSAAKPTPPTADMEIEDLPVETPGGYDSDPPGFRLTKIGDIEPYADYEPDADLRRTDPYRHQCPRPDGDSSDPRNRCPDEYELPLIAGDLRPQQNIGFHWEASNLYSNPLYFDDPKLERYGHTLPPIVQPLASAGRFGVQLIAIPYKATIDPYCKKMYALGFYRPGDCAPKQFEPIPINRDAALVQGAVTTGAIFLFP